MPFPSTKPWSVQLYLLFHPIILQAAIADILNLAMDLLYSELRSSRSDTPSPCNREVECTRASLQNTPVSRLEPLSAKQQQLRQDRVSQLHKEPTSKHLQAFLKGWGNGYSTWDIDTFISLAQSLANLCGSERDKYYDNPLKGLHYPNSYTKLWNQTHPHLPITVLEFDSRHPCPTSWSSYLKEGRRVVTYMGDGPSSQALNELFEGPAALDCGMWCQVFLLMLIRGLFGDELFDRSFTFIKGGLTLTQGWETPMNDAGTEGSLLHDFYDDPCWGEATRSPESQRRIQTMAVFNHSTYFDQHPGGEGRLHNCFKIDNKYYFFDPNAPQSILSEEKFEQRALDVYNAPRDFADEDRIFLYNYAPHYVHPDYDPKSFGDLAEEAKKYENHILSETEWKDNEAERRKKARRLRLIFNLPRLITCQNEAKDAQASGKAYDALSRAKALKSGFIQQSLRRMKSEVAVTVGVKYQTLEEVEAEWASSKDSVIGAQLLLRYYHLRYHRLEAQTWRQRIRQIIEHIARQCMEYPDCFSDDDIAVRLALFQALSALIPVDDKLMEMAMQKRSALYKQDSSLFDDLTQSNVPLLCEKIMGLC